MKNKELFDRTIGILVNAYLKDMLRNGDCAACACGNIIAGVNNWGIHSNEWGDAQAAHWYRTVKLNNRSDKGLYLVSTTGYNIYEFLKIVQSFEKARIDKYEQSERNQYAGLMAVCDTLMQIHEATTEEITQAKLLFTKEPA
jgi:hypothetical protein